MILGLKADRTQAAPNEALTWPKTTMPENDDMYAKKASAVDNGDEGTSGL